MRGIFGFLSHRDLCLHITRFSICVFETMFGSMSGVSNEFLPLEQFLVGGRVLLLMSNMSNISKNVYYTQPDD